MKMGEGDRLILQSSVGGYFDVDSQSKFRSVE
jgi:hypothetical protein